jgi:2-succinyl-6-hydroxy-2,4-cyclohexadiene-1-carboxylate synthase
MIMTKTTLTALHGFLGRAADWGCFSPESLGVSEIYAPDIQVHAENDSLCQWAEIFNLEVTTNILMGYSLGGRLALHALLSQTHRWDAAIIISAHPGLISVEEKKARLTKDVAWADRFEKEPWDDVMALWESQEVFAKSSYRFDRKESDYDRFQLARMLRHWSLGSQDHLTPSLQRLSIPVLWIAGANDATYRDRAASIQLAHRLSRVWIAPNASHRVPWEQPTAFQMQVRLFISTMTTLLKSDLQ